MEFAMNSLKYWITHVYKNYTGVLQKLNEAVDCLYGTETPPVTAAVTPQTPVVAVNMDDENVFVRHFGVIPKRLLHSGPKTIAFWDDGTKTVISLSEGTPYDKSTAFCWALAKRIFGSTNAIKKIAETVTVEQKIKTKKNEPDEKPTPVQVPESTADAAHQPTKVCSADAAQRTA